MNYPKISIVTPSFNQAEYLESTIRSVIDQNYPNLEYIIIDGGSTDKSIEIIKKYADKITYWVSEEDKGQYDAINKGFSMSTGEIMGWINSSDILYPWTLKIIAEIFYSFPQVQWLTGMQTALYSIDGPYVINVSREKNIYDFLAGNYRWIQQESTFWSRVLWNKSGGKLDISVKYAEDFGLWLRFFKYAELYNVNTILGGFRYHHNNRGEKQARKGGFYYNESALLMKEFKSSLPLKFRLRALLVKFFFLRWYLSKKVIKKLRIFKWYRHRYLKYNFHLLKWEIDIR
jgi:glycosyltransferase involved in cell wall biosynthesis